MRFFSKLLLVSLVVLGGAWFAWKVELGGRTILERLTGGSPAASERVPQPASQRPQPERAKEDHARRQPPRSAGSPMEELDDEDRARLQRLVQQQSR